MSPLLLIFPKINLPLFSLSAAAVVVSSSSSRVSSHYSLLEQRSTNDQTISSPGHVVVILTLSTENYTERGRKEGLRILAAAVHNDSRFPFFGSREMVFVFHFLSLFLLVLGGLQLQIAAFKDSNHDGQEDLPLLDISYGEVHIACMSISLFPPHQPPTSSIAGQAIFLKLRHPSGLG